MHWIERVVDDLVQYITAEKKKDKGDLIIINGGLSVSGLQHIGRLRGEVIIGEIVRKILEKRGYRVKQYLVLYTQDAWKGKEAQVRCFPDEKTGKKYTGWPLIRVPDPYRCHHNWVEHFWEDFGEYIDKFTDGNIEVITTTTLYESELRGTVKEAIEKKDKLRELINKYRGRNPYPEDWIPFEPICNKCGRIDTTIATKYFPETEEVEYRCDNCGNVGRASLSEGKLNWRIEWASIWKTLRIDFEPFGKDHAAPGGSRDSCVDLSINIFGTRPPLGLPYEWVSLRADGKEFDMGSSDFIGITPKEWYEIAHPEVLRFLYLKEHHKRKVVIDLSAIPAYYDEFFKAESIYYQALEFSEGLEGLSEEKYVLAKSYEMSLLSPAPLEIPIQVPYLTISLAAQLVPKESLIENVIRRLKSSKIISKELTSHDYERLAEMVWRARNWVERYAPKHVKFQVVTELDESILKKLKYKDVLVSLGKELERLSENWNESSIKETMIKITKDMSEHDRREFYREFYEILVGREYGPRAASLVEVLGLEFIKKRLVEDLTS